MSASSLPTKPLEPPDAAPSGIWRLSRRDETIGEFLEINAEGALDRVFSSQPKVRILRILLQHPTTPCSLAIELQVSQGTASNHLAALHGFGVVESVVKGRRRIYSISSSKLAATLRTRLKPDDNQERDVPVADTPVSSSCTCVVAKDGD